MSLDPEIYDGHSRRLRDLHSSGRRSPQRDRGPLVVAGLALLVAAGLGAIVIFETQNGEGRIPAAPGSVVISLDDEVLAQGPVAALEEPSERQALIRELPRVIRSKANGATLESKPDTSRTSSELDAVVAAGGGAVEVRTKVTAAEHRLPIVQQALRNNCETAALSMLLTASDISVDQLELQDELPAEEPLDPEARADLTVWGDPDRGFVGRPDGGGPAGGYGVYQDPILELAREQGADPVDLTGEQPKTIYRRLLSGRPVMVWIGLSDGPYETWVTPEGRDVTGNFGEHTVVLTGIDGETVSVNDPLEGVRTKWTLPDFEAKWRLLGQRAISL